MTFQLWFVLGVLVFIFKSKKLGLLIVLGLPVISHANGLIMALVLVAVFFAAMKWAMFAPFRLIRGFWRQG